MKLPRLYKHKRLMALLVGLPATVLGGAFIFISGGYAWLFAQGMAQPGFNGSEMASTELCLFMGALALLGSAGLFTFWQWVARDIEQLPRGALRAMALRLSLCLLATVPVGLMLIIWNLFFVLAYMSLCTLTALWMVVELLVLARRQPSGQGAAMPSQEPA